MCPECRHIMPSGRKCHAPALRGKSYCYFHIRPHRVAAKPAPVPAQPLNIPIPEDSTAIRRGLAQIINAMGPARLDPDRARLCLYALQIAMQNIARTPDIAPGQAVDSVTYSHTGDELGPIHRFCEPSDDCSACSEQKSCEYFAPEADEAEN